MSISVHPHRNISFAVPAALRDLLTNGKQVTIRGETILELRNRITVLEQPLERCLFLPHRGHSIVGNVAETLWVLAGRNDIAWLETYLPRAKNFSDDGTTWRAAYGPRLRNWQGVDQFKEVRDLIRGETETRRAVMSLFDPGQDYVASKDIPCNNWLHWLVRDGRLHLNVGVRSNDAIWGFSGVNSFEWSTLHQMMAYWCGVPVGEATFLASSFHIYQRHFEKAKKVAAAFRRVTCYDFGLPSPEFQTSLHEFGRVMTEWFRIEEEFRKSPDSGVKVADHVGDPLLANMLELTRLHHGALAGWQERKLGHFLAGAPESDLTAAAYEFFGRKQPELLKEIRHPRIAQFMERYLAGKPAPPDQDEIKTFIKRLHAGKDLMYGPAWKRRGEMTSILANVARKVDRIEEYLKSSTTFASESIIDTAVDLFVYLTKYRLFLLQKLPDQARELLAADAPREFSDHAENFDTLADRSHPADTGTQTDRDIAQRLIEDFEVLHKLAEHSPDMGRRFENVSQLTKLSLRYLFVLIDEHGMPN